MFSWLVKALECPLCSARNCSKVFASECSESPRNTPCSSKCASPARVNVGFLQSISQYVIETVGILKDSEIFDDISKITPQITYPVYQVDPENCRLSHHNLQLRDLLEDLI